MEIDRWRGSPSQPGLMMALRRGGSCQGEALQLSSHNSEAQLVKLLRREVDTEEDLQHLKWLSVVTDIGEVGALTFWVEPKSSRFFAEKSLHEQARMLARACGSIGSGADYLWRTLESLRALGVVDDYLERLAAAVATVILADADRSRSGCSEIGDAAVAS